MEKLLEPISTSYRSSSHVSNDKLREIQQPSHSLPYSSMQPSTPEQALEILRAEPGLDALGLALRYLVQDAPSKPKFSIRHPSPVAAQLINIISSDIISNYWPILNEASSNAKRNGFKHSAERNWLLSCLKSLSGLNAILGRIKATIQQAKEANKKKEGFSSIEVLRIQLDVLETLLQGDQVVSTLWNDLRLEAPPKQKFIWHEVTLLLGSGKITNLAAEATSIINNASKEVVDTKWIIDAQSYSRWLAHNIISWCRDLPTMPDGPGNFVHELFSKSLRLGNTDDILDANLDLVLGDESDRTVFGSLMSVLTSSEQRIILNAAIRRLSKKYLPGNTRSDDEEWWNVDTTIISAAAGYLTYIMAKEESRKAHLITWLTSLSGAGVGDGVGIRRAALAVFSKSKYDTETILEKSLHQFGDQLYIRHAPILQQEVHAQVLLLSAGYVHRLSPLKLSMMLRSSVYLNAVSHRLAASSSRARFLGMVVGEALSSLVEKPDKQMNFKIEELDSKEAQWYKSLSGVQDSIGPFILLKHFDTVSGAPQTTQSRLKKAAPLHSVIKTQSKVISIQEVDDDDKANDDDLVPYAKPDSDEEDSDEDPTLVQRNKPVAPVYIRDLIIYLRDTENYDRQRLALFTASSLIRRKANFGTEVSAHAEELATLLVGLQDKFDLENFQDMRLQGMIAILIAQPAAMAKWFSKTFFEGDYSVSQRASVLTVLSVSARELGGFKEQDASLTSMKPLTENAFPSKLLPERLDKTWALEKQLHSPVDNLSRQLSDTMIQPLAASLADKVTGPDILKVRTFSSRLAVESRRKIPTANVLSTIVADSFFFPLTGRFFANFKAYGSKNVIFEPYLLSSFLKTLSLILHASGTSTLQLPQMTSEMWDLLLSLQTQGVGERSIGEAMLFGFMTLLEANQDKRRVAETYGRELLEAQSWVELMFQKIGPGSEEDDKMRALAAGVLFKIREVVEKYQALLMGELSSF